jgi:hypothetical protein
MSALASLPIIDLSAQIAALPRRPGHQVIPARTAEEFVTFHYSGVVYADRSRAAELQRILNEAIYQLQKNWAKPGRRPIYGDRFMYDLVVLSDGGIVRTGDRRQFWHCANALGNRASWSVHAMLGSGQDLAAPQRASLFALFDALRSDGGIPRRNVVAHCEWPMTGARPVRSTSYRLLAGQSECPGATLFPHIAAYRALSDVSAPAVPEYRCRYNGSRVRQGPGQQFGQAIDRQKQPIYMQAGEVKPFDAVVNGTPPEGSTDPRWAHRADHSGFVHISLLEAL